MQHLLTRDTWQGGNKGGMGYDEEQFSLPRWVDLSVSRQTVYDGTLAKPPSQGWMFLPLVTAVPSRPRNW